jgi:hypothetical protein
MRSHDHLHTVIFLDKVTHKLQMRTGRISTNPACRKENNLYTSFLPVIENLIGNAPARATGTCGIGYQFKVFVLVSAEGTFPVVERPETLNSMTLATVLITEQNADFRSFFHLSLP